MKELIELAKRQPARCIYSSPGNGGPQHLAMELVKLETGMDIVHVPYKAAAARSPTWWADTSTPRSPPCRRRTRTCSPGSCVPSPS